MREGAREEWGEGEGRRIGERRGYTKENYCSQHNRLCMNKRRKARNPKKKFFELNQSYLTGYKAGGAFGGCMG